MQKISHYFDITESFTKQAPLGYRPLIYRLDREPSTDHTGHMARKVEKLRDKAHEELVAVAAERDRQASLNKLIAYAPSTKDLQKAILALFAEKDFNPVAEMIDMAQGKDGELEVKDKIALCKALSDFFPKPKTMEISGTVDTTTTFIIQNFNPTSKGPTYSKQDYKDI